MTEGYIYCIQRITGGPVKIGWATDPHTRMAQLQTGVEAPLRLLGCCPGTMGLEKAIHEAFAVFRLGGEWFDPAPEIIDLSSDWAAQMQSDAPSYSGTIDYLEKASAALAKHARALRSEMLQKYGRAA